MKDKQTAIDNKKNVSKKNNFSEIVIGILFGIGLVIATLTFAFFMAYIADHFIYQFTWVPAWLLVDFIMPLIGSYLISRRWDLKVAGIAFAVSMVIIFSLFLL